MIAPIRTPPNGSSDVAIECSALVKCYGERRAVDGVDLAVKRGTCFGLLGPNGAGKTTTVEILEGLTAPTSGTVRIFGLEWGIRDERALRERIGVQLQETVLADKLTVEEVITLFRSFYRQGVDPNSVIAQLSLESSRRQRYHLLSGGQKQRVAVACALVGQPELLFLDEPTTGLDPRARQQLWKVVEDFRAGGGTIVLTTHYMEEAASLCDEIAFMDQGRIVATGTPRALIDRLGEVQFLEFESQQELDEAVLGNCPAVLAVRRQGPRYRLQLERTRGALSKVLGALELHGIEPIGLAAHQATLDDVFLQLTGHRLEPADQEATGQPQPGAANA